MDRKKSVGTPMSRWADRRKALEQKQQLVERLKSSLSRKKQVRVESAETSSLTPPSPTPSTIDAQSLVPVFGRAHVRLWRHSEIAEGKVGRALAELVDLTLKVAQTRERIVVLEWPGAITRLPLIHVLSTLERWAAGNKKGLRTGLYPAKANSFDHLNHIWLDRNDILGWARELVETPGEPNAKVTHAFPRKDAFLFSLSSLPTDDGESLHPTAGELIPRFTANSGFARWSSCESHLLENVTARLKRRHSRSLRREQCAVIGQPEDAPDAIFSFHYSMSRNEVSRALRALVTIGLPEVFLIDATRATRRTLGGSWSKRIADFVSSLHQIHADARPGLVLFADEPQVAGSLRNACIDACMQLDRNVRRLTNSSFAVRALPCSVLVDGLISPGVDEPKAPKPLSIRVSATDADAARVVSTLDRFAADCTGGREAAPEVVEAAKFLHRLSVLPSSIRHLMEWLDDVGADARLRDKFTWLFYRGRLNEFIERNGRGDAPAAVDRALANADQMWAHYQNGTAFAEQLATAVGAASKSSKRIAVVFDRPLRRRLAERFLLDYAGFPGGKRLADFQARVRLILGDDIEQQLAEGWATRYVFAGLDDKVLRTLIVDDRLPQDALVLLSQRSAQYLHGVLRRIIAYEAFGIYKPRIESMLRQLANFAALDDKLVIRSGDIALPDFDYQEVLDSGRNADQQGEVGFEVVVEGGRRIFRRRGSEVFLYDPTHPDAGDRGFRRISLDHLKPGDRLFDMSADLREQVEDALKDAGVPIQRDKRFEASLRKYHEVVSQAVASQFVGPTLAAVVRQLRTRMIEENPATKTWPTEAAVRHWIDLGRNTNTAFEDLQPQAPLKREHYFALGNALRLNDVVTQYFLYDVILPIRNARRLDGRYVSDTYSHMLLDPESVVVHAGIKRDVIEDLFLRAMDNIYSVEAVHAPAED